MVLRRLSESLEKFLHWQSKAGQDRPAVESVRFGESGVILRRGEDLNSAGLRVQVPDQTYSTIKVLLQLRLHFPLRVPWTQDFYGQVRSRAENCFVWNCPSG